VAELAPGSDLALSHLTLDSKPRKAVEGGASFTPVCRRMFQAARRKASRSNAGNGGCVEIAANFDDVVAVRDSKRPEARAHIVGRAAFAAFPADVKARLRSRHRAPGRLSLGAAECRRGPPGSVPWRKPLGCPPQVPPARRLSQAAMTSRAVRRDCHCTRAFVAPWVTVCWLKG
jgi:hypothetical protein